MPSYYRKAAINVEKSINGREYDYIFEVQKKLLDVLSIKCDLGVRLRTAYQKQNREEMSIILPNTTAEEALFSAKRMNKAVAEKDFHLNDYNK